MRPVDKSVIMDSEVLTWSTALDYGVGQEWCSHAVRTIGGDYKFVNFIDDKDEVGLHIRVLSMVNKMSGTMRGFYHVLGTLLLSLLSYLCWDRIGFLKNVRGHSHSLNFLWYLQNIFS